MFSLRCFLHYEKVEPASAMSALSTSSPKTNAEFVVESVKDAAIRLKCASMADSAEIACGMLANLSNAHDMSVGKEDVIDLLGIVEELETRQFVLSNGVSVAARDFAMLEGDDFNSAVNAICALRLFCAKASSRLDGTGDVGSELWLVHFLTRAKTQLDKTGAAERKKLIDLWLKEVWRFVDTRECNAYKETRKLWDAGFPQIRAKGANDDHLKAFVDRVRGSFIDRLSKMGEGHVVPWSVEFTFDFQHR